MASGKQSKRKRKEVAQAPPPVRRKGEAARPSNRVLLSAGLVILLVAAAVIAVVSLSTSTNSSLGNVPTIGSLSTSLPGAGAVNDLLKGIPQNSNVLGSPQAPVTMVEYIDLQCPFCQQFETSSFLTLVKNYVRPGKVKIEARPIAFIGPDSATGRKAALAAAAQNSMFNFMALLYDNQGPENTGWLSHDMIVNAAASIPGLRVKDLLAASNSSAVTAQAKQYDAAATKGKVTSTPTILVGKSGGKLTQVSLSSPSDTAAVVAAIQSAGG